MIGYTISKGSVDIEVLVSRLLQSEKSVKGKSLEWGKYEIGSPTDGANIVVGGDGNRLFVAFKQAGAIGSVVLKLMIEAAASLIVSTANIGELRGKRYPLIVPEDTSVGCIDVNWFHSWHSRARIVLWNGALHYKNILSGKTESFKNGISEIECS